MMVGGPSARPISDRRPWTFYALGGLFAAYLLFLYGPMFVIYLLSFQGENGGVTFPMPDNHLFNRMQFGVDVFFYSKMNQDAPINERKAVAEPAEYLKAGEAWAWSGRAGATTTP